ncbi:MAG: hypothetical protein BWY53_00579 [Parcubacteria group bacterium ADurb.Bin326]|nr:MAG: hypothetical protein BWY53_00579 [Parcubacteria group bacterium ADurb.Bin326]
MLWFLTKRNHRLSTGRLVRWWLRMTVLDRVITLIVLVILHAIMSFFTIGLWAISKVINLLLEGASRSAFSEFLGEEAGKGMGFVIRLTNFSSGFLMFFEVIITIAVFAFFIFFIVDLIWDFVATRLDLMMMSAKDDITLATRGEYVGGHPSLPHSRFVYLVISGTQTSPFMAIVLPSLKPVKFKIPLMDITTTKSEIDNKFGKPSIFNITLTSITPSIWKGYRSVINIDYVSTGRKYTIELGAFLRGNDEVQMWKNYLVCTQAQADTQKEPYGFWKSLPEQPIERKEEYEENKSND